MQARAYYQGAKRDVAGEINHIDLIETVASLRNDVCSMSTDIREVLSENAKLKEEVSRLQSRQVTGKSRNPKSEAKRIKQELDQLVRLHDIMSSDRNEMRETSKPSISSGNNALGNSSWMKKMMMFMMMSEIV